MIIRTENVRTHELTGRQVRCINARKNGSTIFTHARVGEWLVWTETDGGRNAGRMLGRVDAGPVTSETPEYRSPAVEGWISVLALSQDMSFAMIRWINPEHVISVSAPPAALLAFMTGPLPSPAMVHKLSAYGTLSESYVANVPHHVTAFKAGVGPAAWDAGIRRECPTCLRGIKAKERHVCKG